MANRALKLGSLAIFVVGSVELAGAADLPRKAPPIAPPVAFSWTGCYIGGYAGAADPQRSTFTDLGNATFRAFSGGITAGRIENTHSWNVDLDTSFIGGGTVGCNW